MKNSLYPKNNKNEKDKIREIDSNFKHLKNSELTSSQTEEKRNESKIDDFKKYQSSYTTQKEIDNNKKNTNEIINTENLFKNNSEEEEKRINIENNILKVKEENGEFDNGKSKNFEPENKEIEKKNNLNNNLNDYPVYELKGNQINIEDIKNILKKKLQRIRKICFSKIKIFRIKNIFEYLPYAIWNKLLISCEYCQKKSLLKSYS